MFRFFTRLFYRGVPGFATGCPCSVWCRGLNTCLLHVGPFFGNLVWNDSGLVSQFGKYHIIIIYDISHFDFKPPSPSSQMENNYNINLYVTCLLVSALSFRMCYDNDFKTPQLICIVHIEEIPWRHALVPYSSSCFNKCYKIGGQKFLSVLFHE